MSDNKSIEEKFNNSTVQVVIFSQAASINAQVDTIFLESFVIGILNTGENEVSSMLVEMEVDLAKCLKIFKNNLKNKRKVKDKTEHPDYGDLTVDQSVYEMLRVADGISQEEGRNHIGIQHVFSAILAYSTNIRSIFENEGLDVEKCLELLKNVEERAWSTTIHDPSKKSVKKITSKSNKNQNVTKESLLADYCTNMTEQARQNELDPIMARDPEIELAITILCRRNKNNPMLVGPTGVGKTAIVEGIAQRIVSGTVPEKLKKCELYSLSISSIVAGTKYRGQFEERVEKLMRFTKESEDIILFIDELHSIVGAGATGEGALDVSNIMKPYLARGDLCCIGATTEIDFRKYIQKDKALERRFQKIDVQAPTKDETRQILHGIRPIFEEHHNCIVSNDAIEAILTFTEQYQPSKNWPDKAIDCLDSACAKNAWNKDKKSICMNHVATVISEAAKIPIEIILWDTNERIKNVEEILQKRFVGQKHALSTVCRALKNSYSGIKDPSKPILSAVFGGPTGTGKTYLARELATAVFGKSNAFIRVDMSEYMDRFSSSKLVGSPPGYVGFNEGEVFVDKVRRNPHSVILFDETEKAHPDILKLLLQVLSEGEMKDSTGNVVDFRNTIIIMTGNFGLNESKKSIGFGDDILQDEIENETERLVQFFSDNYGKEFNNKIDEFVLFLNLTDEEKEIIVGIQLSDFSERVAHRNCKITYTKSVLKAVVEKSKEEHGQNAKPLERIIKKEIEACVADVLLDLKENSGIIALSVKNNKFIATLRKKKEIK